MNNQEHPLITEYNSLIQKCLEEIKAVGKEFNLTPETIATCSNDEIINANKHMPQKIREVMQKQLEQCSEILLQLPPTENTKVCLMLFDLNIEAAKALIDFAKEQAEIRGCNP